MDYISTKKAAEKWGISTSRIVRLANGNRIPGAVLVGKSWLIPENAEKPADNRTKIARHNFTKNIEYHFPLCIYGNFSRKDYKIKLDSESQRIFEAECLFEAGNLGGARVLFEDILSKTESIYIRIGALYHLSIIYFLSREYDKFNYSTVSLQIIFNENFPHKKELELLPYDITIISNGNKELLDVFSIDAEHDFSFEALPYLTLSSAYNDVMNAVINNYRPNPSIYELVLYAMENNKYYFPAMMINFYVAIMYKKLGNDELCDFHVEKALDYACEFEYYTTLAFYTQYVADSFDKIYRKKSADYRKKLDTIKKISTFHADAFAAFYSHEDKNGLMSTLKRDDYSLVTYAVLGMTSEQVAKRLGLSTVAINKRYGLLYKKTGVASKKELTEVYIKSINEMNVM